MKVAVTGGTGVVGAALIRELLSRRREVTALVRASSDLRGLQGLDVRLVHGDVLDPKSLTPALTGCELLFHAATIFSYGRQAQDQMERTAIEGTQHVLEAAARAGVRRVVLTSSSVIFGSSTLPVTRTESDHFDDRDAPPYAVSKLQQDRLALQIASALQLDLVVVCPTLVVGPYDYRLGTSNAILVNYLNDPSRATFLGGCNIAAATDIATGHILVAQRGTTGEHYILGGENLTWAELHRIVSEACGLDGPWLTLNHTASYLLAYAAEAYAHWSGRAPAATVDQARMVGRYYWYDHGKSAALGYAPMNARASVVATLKWLLPETEFINRFVRAAMRTSSATADLLGTPP